MRSSDLPDPIPAMVRVSHREIFLRKQLGRNDCASVLHKTLDEEKATVRKLTTLVESKVNLYAAS